MKNAYIIIIVLVLAAIALFFGLSNRNTGEPSTDYNVTVDSQNQNPATTETGNSAPLESINPNAQIDTNVDVGATKEFTVTGQNFSFAPNTISVKKGDKVKITFKNANGNHDFRIDEFGVNSGIIKAGEQKTIEFTADKAGTFEYYCSVGTHRAMGMKGTLKVE